MNGREYHPPHIHNYIAYAIVVYTELTSREAAERLDVNQSRVRALIAAGTLIARRVGTQWLIDADSVDRQAELTGALATGRAMAQRVAWAAGDIADGGPAYWLTAAERYRLRRRLKEAGRPEVVRKWLASRTDRIAHYRIGERAVDELLHTARVAATGVSAAIAYGLGLGAGGDADAYVTSDTADQLVNDFFLIRSAAGNLTLRIVDDAWHLRCSRLVAGQQVTPRLVTGVDLADDRDPRTKQTGHALIDAVLSDQRR